MTDDRSRRSKSFRWLRTLATLGVVGTALYYLGRNLVEGLSQIDIEVCLSRWPLLLASGVLTEFCVFLGTRSYHLIVRGVGGHLPYPRSARVHLVSNLGQFMPGYGWQQAGKVYLASKEGVPVREGSVAMVVEQGTLACAGLTVAALTFSPSWSWVPSVLHRTTYQIVVAAALILALLLLPEALRRAGGLARKWGRPGWELDVGRRALWSAAGVLLLSWTLFGLAFALVAGAFHPLDAQGVAICVFTLVASVLFGWAIPFVPGGIGVREGAMAFLLAAIMPNAIASLVAIVMRLVLVICEVFAALVVWLVTRREARITQTGY